MKAKKSPCDSYNSFQVIYGNGALLRTTVRHPPAAWRKIEPRDVIRLEIKNHRPGDKRWKLKKSNLEAKWIMRPDEALDLISILTQAVQYSLYFLDNGYGKPDQTTIKEDEFSRATDEQSGRKTR